MNPREERLWGVHKEAVAKLEAHGREVEALCKKEANRDWTRAEVAANDKIAEEVQRARRAAQAAGPGGATPKLHLPTGSGFPAVHTDRYRSNPAKLRVFKNEPELAEAFGAWAGAVLKGGRRFTEALDSFGLDIGATMTGNVQSKGGALVPDEFMPGLIAFTEQWGVIRKWADNMPMASDSKIVPCEIGGQTVYFPSEAADITESDPEVTNIQLTARKMACLSKISSELFEDSLVDIGERVAFRMMSEMLQAEDAAGFVGDGTSTHGGMVGSVTKINNGNYSNSIHTALAGNTAFSTLDLADFEGVMGLLPEYPGADPAWYISRKGWAASMLRLANAVGGITKSEISGGRMDEFLGFPVRFSSKLNSTLTAQVSTVLCLFGDLRQSVTLGDRRMFTFESSSGGDDFKADKIATKLTSRIDIVAHFGGLSNSSDPSVCPMEALKTPAS